MERDTFHMSKKQLKDALEQQIADLSNLLGGLNAMVGRGEISGLMAKRLEGRYTDDLRNLKKLYALKFPFRRRQAEQPLNSVLDTVFCADTITRSMSAVAMNERRAH